MTEKYLTTVDLLMIDPVTGDICGAKTLYSEDCFAGGATAKFSEFAKQFTELFGEPDLSRPIGSSWTEFRWDNKHPCDKVLKLVISWEVPAHYVLDGAA